LTVVGGNLEIGLFSNFAPQRREAGWGRGRCEGQRRYVVKLCSPTARGRLGPRWTGRPHRFYAGGEGVWWDRTGWGRRMPGLSPWWPTIPVVIRKIAKPSGRDV